MLDEHDNQLATQVSSEGIEGFTRKELDDLTAIIKRRKVRSTVMKWIRL